MKKVTVLRINRKRWWRGQGSDDSRLRKRKDGKQCCIGFYARACGLKITDIEGCATLAALDSDELRAHESKHNKTFSDLYEVNDDAELTAKDRESKIRQLFKDLGVKKVVFT